MGQSSSARAANARAQRGGSAGEAGAYCHGDVGLVGEQPVEAEAVEELELRGEISPQGLEEGIERIADAEVGGEEAVLGAEGPRVDQQTGLVSVGNQGGGGQ